MANITTGSFLKALKPQVQAWFGDMYKDYPSLYKEIFEVISSDDAFEEDVLLSGLGLGKIKPQGAAASFDDMQQGYTKRYDHVMYANGFVITREMIEDGKAPARAERFTKSLKRGMLQTLDVVTSNHLNRAFDSTYTGGDGIELSAANHPTLGADLRNELSTTADLSEASLEQAIIDMMDFRDNRGLRMMARPRKLIVPTAEAFNAERLLKSNLRPDSANNDLNAVKNMGLMPEGILVNPYLTDTDAFFILTDVPDGLKFIERTSLRVEDDNEFDTMNAKFLASIRFISGWTDPRGIFCSQGA